MSKKSAPRRLDETEAKAFLRVVSVSARKLNLVAQSIRGKSASSALAELTFSPRRVAAMAVGAAQQHRLIVMHRRGIRSGVAGNAARAFGIGFSLGLAARRIRRLHISALDSDIFIARQQPGRSSARQQDQGHQQKRFFVPACCHRVP